MKQEIDNNAMWAAFRQELALQGELQVVAAIDNALNNLGFTIEETSTIIPISLKQGEQKPYGQRQKCVNCQFNYAGECKGSCVMRKSEQKPTDKVEPKFKIGNKIVEKDFGECSCGTIIDIKDGKYIFDDGGFICIEEQGLWKLVEQKSAWSEEDEAGLGDALWAIQQARTIAKDENDMGNLWYAENWLKSLKDRYTWKPSDEQMAALNDINVTGCLTYAGQGQELINLYEQLKALHRYEQDT